VKKESNIHFSLLILFSFVIHIFIIFYSTKFEALKQKKRSIFPQEDIVLNMRDFSFTPSFSSTLATQHFFNNSTYNIKAPSLSLSKKKKIFLKGAKFSPFNTIINTKIKKRAALFSPLVSAPKRLKKQKTVYEIAQGYLSLIRRRIMRNQIYPLLARRKNQKGKVIIKFTLKSSGEIIGNIEVVSPAKYDILNISAIKMVKKSAPFPPFPRDLKKDKMSFIVPIDFSLF